jgi:lysozyme
MTRRAHGLDVSTVQDQATPIDWEKVAEQDSPASPRIEFVVAKCTSGIGDDVDRFFQWHCRGARAIGRLFGAYHWWVFSRNPAQQADDFERAIARVGGVDLPWMIDFEYPPPADWKVRGLDPQIIAPSALVLANEIARRSGKRPVLYTYPDFKANLPKAGPGGEALLELAEIADLWIAAGPHYLRVNEQPREDDDTPGVPGDAEEPPHVLAPWAGWRLWQYAGDGGRVPGVVGACDRDLFNGTLADLRAWAGLDEPVPSTIPAPADDQLPGGEDPSGPAA